MSQLGAALRTIHADRGWWAKVLVGGALWLTVLGWPIVEGHQIESLDNSQRGYPTPLPRWSELGNKALIGVFALVIDFFYFVFPILVGGVILFCGTLGASLAASDSIARIIAIGTVGTMVLYIAMVWLLGASPLAKQRYASDGDIQAALNGGLPGEILRSTGRGVYLRARMLSAPPYLIGIALAGLALWLVDRTAMGALVVLWVALSALVYARLVTIQLYLAATRTVERLRFEALRR